MAVISKTPPPSENTSLVKCDFTELSDPNSHRVIIAEKENPSGEKQGTCISSPTPGTGSSSENAVDENEEDNNISGRKLLIKLLSGKGKYTLIAVMVASFLSGSTFALIAPFYPKVAAQKGMDGTTIGFVFGVFEITIFFTAPIYGHFLVTLGPKCVYVSGIFVGSCCNLLFGSLQFCSNGLAFAVLSILIRATSATGYAACNTAGFAILTHEFKGCVGMTIGLLKTSSGLGLMLGPSIGAFFHELSGFALPFYVTGSAGLLNGIAVFMCLPSVYQHSAKRRGSIFGLLRGSMVVIPLCSIFFGMIGMTTYESTLSRHLEPLNLTVGMLGILFGVMACLYSITGAIWGYISDAKNIQAPLIIFAHFVFAFGYLLLGPSFLLPFIPFNLVSTFIGLSCIGASLGSLFIPTMKCMMIGAIELGYEDNISTYGLVSGLFTCIQTFGGFIGPVGVGYLAEQFDFPVAYTVVALFHLGMLVVSITFFTLRSVRRRSCKSEEKPHLTAEFEYDRLS